MNDINIIDNPNLKGFFRNMGEWSFTVLMWGVWVYFLSGYVGNGFLPSQGVGEHPG